MTEEDSVNRRQFLKKASFAGGFTIGGRRLVRETDITDSTTDSQKQMALSAPPTQSILTALDQPAVDRESIEVKDVTVGTTSLTVTTIPTREGAVAVGEDSAGRSVAHFDLASADRATLPSAFGTIPDNTNPTLFGKSDSVTLVREATPQEKRAVDEALEVAHERTTVFTSTEIDGFEAHIETDEGMERRIVTPDGLEGFSALGDNDDCISASSVSTSGCGGGGGGGGIADGWNCNDQNWCVDCVNASITCTGCYATCSGSLVIYPAIVACALCLYTACPAAAGYCTICAECES